MGQRKLLTGIASFDIISNGGLPAGRTTLVAGSSGSGKTLFAAQFLAMGIMEFNQPGIFITFEEQAEDIRDNLRSFGWDIDTWEKEGKWVFMDISPDAKEQIAIGEYDLSALRLRIERAVTKVKAQRIVIDSITSIFVQYPKKRIIRREMFKIALCLKALGVTSLITTERTKEYGKISRFGVEEFLLDNVIVLRNVLGDEKRRRTIEILKFRGHTFVKGETPFTIVPDQAIVIIPLSLMGQKRRSLKKRVSSGIPKLDEMCGGGFYHDSIILISGATGAGKTLLVSSFVTGLQENKERALLVMFEESTEQLHRNAKGWGKKFVELEKKGLLKIVSIYPESSSLEDHFINIQKIVKEFKPMRLAVDSLTTLVRNSTDKGFREFILALTSFLKDEEVTVMFTATPPTLTGGISNTEDSISSITDTIILLRYVEMSGEMQRSIAVLKLRGSLHDTAIRRFTIHSKGMEIGEPFEGVSGILTGNQVIVLEGGK